MMPGTCSDAEMAPVACAGPRAMACVIPSIWGRLISHPLMENIGEY